MPVFFSTRLFQCFVIIPQEKEEEDEEEEEEGNTFSKSSSMRAAAWIPLSSSQACVQTKSCIGKRFAETRLSSKLTLEYPNHALPGRLVPGPGAQGRHCRGIAFWRLEVLAGLRLRNFKEAAILGRQLHFEHVHILVTGFWLSSRF